jgi:IclR family acetate operon transcriptional repressor
MSNETTSQRAPRRIKAVVNAMRLLEELKAARTPLQLGELSRRLGLHKSTLHLLLATLADHGFVEAAGGRGAYRLGLGAFEVGSAAVDHLNMPSEFGPLMEQLAGRSLEAVSLLVRMRDSALIVRRYESEHILRVDIGVGTRLPLDSSASGKCLLADLTEDELRELLVRSRMHGSAAITTASLGSLVEELARVRRKGYAMNHDELLSGITGVAAPVRDRDGRTIAALTIAGPKTRFNEQRWLKDVVRTAAQMSRLLGFESGMERTAS